MTLPASPLLRDAGASAGRLPPVEHWSEPAWDPPEGITYASRWASRECRRGRSPGRPREPAAVIPRLFEELRRGAAAVASASRGPGRAPFSGDPAAGEAPVPRPAAEGPGAGPAVGAAKSGRARGVGRFAVRVLLGAASGLGLGLLALVSVPVLFGCRSLVVMSGSMEPAVHTGSVVVVERIPADRVAVGDVISFVDPDDPSRLITHRVHGLSLQAGGLAVETQGDANSGREEWRIDPEGTVGRVRLQVPLLGYLLGPLQGRASRLLLVVVPAALLALLLLFSIWRREESGLERPGSSGRRPRLSVGRLPSPAGREAR